MKIILASKSPRRKDILNKFGYSFEILESDFCESVEPLSPEHTALFNARGKALSVFNSLSDKECLVLGADTVVELDGQILGKPIDQRHAMSMLLQLSGKTHRVITGWAIIGKDINITNATTSYVTFNDLEIEQIAEYVKSKLPLDKAGSYGIQDGYGLVKEYKGSLNNVIGLPIEDIKPILDELLK